MMEEEGTITTEDDGIRKEDTIQTMKGHNNEHNNMNESDHDRQHSNSRRCIVAFNNFWHSIRNSWPRTYSMILGVTIPLWAIVALSIWCGHLLANLEADNEIESNNAALASRAKIFYFSNQVSNITSSIPMFCLDSFFNRNKTIPSEVFLKSHVERLIIDHELYAIDDVEDNMTPGVGVDGSTSYSIDSANLADVSEFMMTCGDEVRDIVDLILNDTFGIIHDEDGVGDVTFNWIRCKAESNETNLQSFGKRLRPGISSDQVEELQKQSNYVESMWMQNQLELYDLYFSELYDPKMNNETSTGKARYDALQYSVGNATGFESCEPNSAAAGWFWFTVMTTIGYGNQAPITPEGRSMVFTLGFISILLFGALLSRAGIIVTALFDDIVSRWSVTNKIFHTYSIVQVVFWGFLYYLWMLVIALYYQSWKELRLGLDNFHLGDAYWFAYVSSTTVGLGDYYLESEAILEEDLIYFPLLFLFGFILLANFLVKLTDMVKQFIPNKLETLEYRLQSTNLILCTSICSKRNTNADNNSDRSCSSDDLSHHECSIKNDLTLKDVNDDGTICNTDRTTILSDLTTKEPLSP